ncbi:MAG: efflux RND transporter periplasmic adaptor subunit [Candidatus Gastranaerophilales bacterium]|nr:efflux RND transporter periplasmic adaptor subunit [Candidatus Gastranaerophilales bacterium]
MLKRVLIIAFTVLLLIFIICFFLFQNRGEKPIILYGNVEIRQSDLAFRVSGRLLKLYAEEGDEVKEGMLLAEIDPDTYKTALLRAKASVKEKRAQKLQKKAVYEFNYPLCKDYTVSKEECSNLKYDRDFASSAYDFSLSELEQAVINLNDTKLYAPYDGIILSRIREKGSILSTNDIVYSISMIEPVWIRAYVEEKQLGRIKLGQKALVYTDARPKNPYIAHVGFVSPVAEFTPKTVETTTLRADLVYRLRIIIDKTDPFLRQGMPVTVRLSDNE